MSSRMEIRFAKLLTRDRFTRAHAFRREFTTPRIFSFPMMSAEPGSAAATDRAEKPAAAARSTDLASDSESHKPFSELGHAPKSCKRARRNVDSSHDFYGDFSDRF